MRTRGIGSLIVFMALCWSSLAQADYVCFVIHRPATYSSAVGYGTEGSLHVSLYTGPSCTGTFVNQYTLCSTGAATGGACATATACGGVDYLYTATELNAIS